MKQSCSLLFCIHVYPTKLIYQLPTNAGLPITNIHRDRVTERGSVVSMQQSKFSWRSKHLYWILLDEQPHSKEGYRKENRVVIRWLLAINWTRIWQNWRRKQNADLSILWLTELIRQLHSQTNINKAVASCSEVAWNDK